MPQEAVLEAQGSAEGPHRQVRGRTRLGPLSDLKYRSVERLQAEAWCNAVYAEIGGADALTARERDAVERAGVAYAMHRDLQHRYAHGEPIDPADVLASGNQFRRCEGRIAALIKRLTRRNR
jgi:hypothetical protein